MVAHLIIADYLKGSSGTLYRRQGDAWVQGVEVPSDLSRPVGEAVVDSRLLTPTGVFFALKGGDQDGHDYVGAAFQAGAKLAVVNEHFIPRLDALPKNENRGSKEMVLVTRDPLTALQEVASYWRGLHSLQVIGVTGSLGKTSIKEAVAHVLEARGSDRVLKSRENLNTEIGLPLELLRLTDRHQFAVLEMGMYQPGDIKMLASIARPDIGIVANVQANHLERTGSMEKTARGKAELVHALPADGLAVLNVSDPYVSDMRFATQARCATFTAIVDGATGACDFRAANVRGKGRSGFEAVLIHGHHRVAIACPTPGRHNVVNLLPAAAVGHYTGVSWGEMVGQVETFTMPSRASFVPGPRGSLLLDDRYNASAPSVTAALTLLSEVPGRHLAILGEMYELGSAEKEQHRLVGKAAASLDHVILIGDRTRWVAESARECGLADSRIERAKDNEQAIEMAKNILRKGDVMLIKGSRGLHLEEVVRELQTTDSAHHGAQA